MPGAGDHSKLPEVSNFLMQGKSISVWLVLAGVLQFQCLAFYVPFDYLVSYKARSLVVV